MTLTTSVVVNDSTPAPTAAVQRTNGSYGPIAALGAVHLGELTVQTSGDPEKLRAIAAAFTAAADLMDATNTAIADERDCSTTDGALTGQSA